MLATDPAAPNAPAPTSKATRSPALSTSAAASSSISVGRSRGATNPGAELLHRVLGGRHLNRRFALDIMRDNDDSDCSFAERHAKGAIDDVPHLLRRRNLYDVCPADVFQHRIEIGLLLHIGTDTFLRLLPNYCHHRLMIERAQRR